ncbi:SARP family transcriptional regulator [Intrasporangium oryzae NRRL B-24470]|uniref:SARP family transcriptional regulator n=1 Tax=Intrasporangium oryzae NRRL B-24470 TaxID=1386089 RepID=W9G0V0_9MICO|nr:SARP family transcriptional regulator [Intrasporangium oryzae NRRL B-24470]
MADDAWVRRQAAQLVQLLALSRDRRLHRDQVIDALWPGLSWEAAGPRLHKAAHYARRALDDPGAVVLRQELVSLFPGHDDVEVDVREFARSATQALQSGDETLAAEALAWYRGPLLPDDPYEPWTEEPRQSARSQHQDLLRLLGRWHDVLTEDPADEQAHVALARARAAAGDARGALVQLERLEQALHRELGAAPGAEAMRLRAELESRTTPRPDPAPMPTPDAAAARLFGRRQAGDQIRALLDEAATGRGATVLVTGPAGVGKSATLDLADVLARRRAWKVARGGASGVEGPWPYSPVLEAFSMLCRRHPALLDALGDDYRAEIERALAGRDLDWTGESGHQRLFVAAAELMRVAAAGPGLLFVVDDLQDADEASLRLLHYLSRCALDERVVLVLAHREPAPVALGDVVASIVSRGGGHRLVLAPLTEGASRRLLVDRFPQLEPDAAEEIALAGGGLPFTMIEMARARVNGSGPMAAPLPPRALRTFQRVALLGLYFSTDELLGLADGTEEEIYEDLEVALAALVVEPTEGGFRFRHHLVRDALVAQLPPHQRSRGHQRVAEALAALDRPPGRVAHHYLAAGLASRAVPYVVRAVETAGALGAFRDALALVDGVREHAGEEHLPVLLSRRGDLLMALGDPGAVAAYTEAARVTSGTLHRLVRARLARAAAVAGDLETAQSALAGLELEGDEADGSLLLAQGNLAYFRGDMETAWTVASEARERLRGVDDPWHLVDLVGLQGLLAHQRGEWFSSFRTELHRTQGHERLAGALFDAHLCVAENLLYGLEPYPEIIAEGEQLRLRARQAGALRGVAFATALIGEAALMMGDVDRAEAELEEAVALHADIDAVGGQAHSMQRLAEVRLAQGRTEDARRLLDEALLLARWSTVGMHLLQRIFGTLIVSAPDPAAARAMVDRAEATMGEPDQCHFCAVMLAVPAAVACARVGDIDEARRHLATAARSVSLWGDSSWHAAVVEASAVVALADGDVEGHRRLAHEAARAYESVGHHADAARVLVSVDAAG